NKDKAREEIKELARDMKQDVCGDPDAYFWVARGKLNIGGDIIETAPTYGWLKTSDIQTDKAKRTPKDYLPGNQARVRAIKRWVRETFPEAKAKMKVITAEWLTRGKDIEDVQQIVEAEYHIVTDTTPSKGGGKIGGSAEEKQGEGESGTTILPPPKETPQKIGVPAAELSGEGFTIDPDLLREDLKQIKWTDDTAKTWLVSHYKVSPHGSLEEVISRLTREQAEEFLKEIQERVAKKQLTLFQ
ncbi:unnamed protein product, partial [marine sediment metagenome]